jgi:type I restriction enzyme M protein
MMSETNNAAFIWSIANLLRGTYKPADYGKVILPFTVLRRLDSALEASKNKVLDEFGKNKNAGAALDFLLQKASGYSFYNTSPYDLRKAAGDTSNLKANLLAYIEGFSPNVRDIFEKYEFTNQLNKLDENDLLLLVVQRFSSMDLHPEKVSNTEMGLIFEELIRKFAEASNETAGDHFTPRDVVRLIVNLLFATDDEVLSKPGVVRSVYDPTAGTGGMLSVADDYIHHLNPEARLTLFGQDYNDESFAIAKADMVIKGQEIENMVFGDTLTNDGHHGKHFDYCLANPPFGVEWKKQQAFVEREHKERGFDGRFGPGTPRVSDGSLLFLLHLVKKMRPTSQGGGRIGIVLNGSPLFTGNAGQGESEIRKYLLEQDLIEAIIALPKDMFYNTGIATYIWILSNHKSVERKGKVQLIDASNEFEKMRKGLGDKKNEISQRNLRNIVKLYDDFESNQLSKIFSPIDFGYTTITVEQPLRLSWAVTKERIDKALAAKAFEKLSAGERLALEEKLLAEAARDQSSTSDQTAFASRISHALSGLSVSTNQIKNLVSGMAEHDPNSPLVRDNKGNLVADVQLRDTENVPLTEDIEEYAARVIAPYQPDFWIDRTKDKIGYEIPFTRHFYNYQAPRPLAEIDADLKKLISQISLLLEDIENE